MKHSVDTTPEKERPNLLSSSNRNSAPNVDILSSLENRQKLDNGNSSGRKKMWLVVFFISLAVGIIGYTQQEKIQNLSSHIAQSFSPTSKPESSVKPMVSINQPSEAKTPPKPVEPSMVDDVKTTLESSAVLVDLPADKEKIAISDETLSNADQQKAPASAPKQSTSTRHTTVSSTNPKSSAKTASHATAEKKHAIAKRDDIEKKIKDPLKTHQTTEKNNPKTYDSDIALLSALVANTSKSRDEISGNMSHTTGAKKPLTPAINLDVVERNPSDNTKNLLVRCEKLGGMEAKLCHDRICSGSWQSESACAPSKG